MKAAYHVITFGETMIRLTPPDLQRVEQTRSFEIHIGGSESNTAIGLARLGLDVLWLSRLTANPLGRLITGELSRHGVDTSQVIWTDEDRIGLYFLEQGRTPRSSRVIYDRARSAFSQLRPADLPADLFQPQKAQIFHTTGITPALSASCMDTTRHAMRRAKEAGWKFSFDLNYRSKLWSPEKARRGYEPFLQQADMIFAPMGDMKTIYNQTSPDQALQFLVDHYPHATIIMTMGKAGALAREPGKPVHQQPAFMAQEVDRLGGGDAFSAGFLYAYLTHPDDETRIRQALRWGAATAAFKYTVHGDAAFVEREEIAALVADETSGQLQR